MSHDVLSAIPLEEVVTLVNKLGLSKSAKRLKVSSSKLSRHLNKHGYHAKPKYIKKEVTLQTT